MHEHDNVDVYVDDDDNVEDTEEPGDDEPGADIIQGVFEPALSLKELAAELNVTAQAIYDLRSQGRGPAGFRVGRCLRFRRSVIQATDSTRNG